MSAPLSSRSRPPLPGDSLTIPLVGLTGSIGSGKSEVARILEREGAAIIDADLLAREVVAPGSAGLREVVDEFGASVLSDDGALNRKALAALVFSDPVKRAKLEQITHPRIRALFLARLAELRAAPAAHRPAIVVYVVPLLFESRYDYEELDAIVVVSTTREVALCRVIARDGCSIEQAESRYNAQLPIAEKVRQADFVIDNSGTLEELSERVRTIFPRLCALTPGG